MALANPKLATSLARLERLQKNGALVFRSAQFTRLDRERLLQNGFLQEVIPGWLISSAPNIPDGDTTSWYASFWEFCAKYCEKRFGAAWCVSPEQSLLLHAEQTAVPKQIVVHSAKGTNNRIDLPFGTSLYDLKQSQMPDLHERAIRDGVRIYTNAAGLLRVSETYFRANPIEARINLATIKDASEVLAGLLDSGRSTVAGRLAGAFRHIQQPGIAEEIQKTMRSAGYDIREVNPFASTAITGPAPGLISPIVTRLRGLWALARPIVLSEFPKPPGLPRNKRAYLRAIDDIYHSDAYHSLSIEGYSVTPELIERVRAGNWNPSNDDADRRHRDALAARGYWQAFQVVKANVAEIIGGAPAAALVRASHRDWYRELFAPCAVAGLIRPSDLAGYRNNAVYLRNSRHVPVRFESVRDAMPALFDLLEEEPSPAVRAVAGHWLFGYIHPYPDGNGRIARFLMNTMLASGGYPWTVIRVEDRTGYLTALESASVESDLLPFVQFVSRNIGIT